VNRRWILYAVVGAVLGIIAIVATPFIVYLIYAMVCKGPDCFR
jgi:hypothetical protein